MPARPPPAASLDRRTRVGTRRGALGGLFFLFLGLSLLGHLLVPELAGAAERRGARGAILDRSLERPVISVAAAARMGVLLGNGGVFIDPPLGYGFGFELRYHALSLGFARLGLQFAAGHTRFQDRQVYTFEDAQGATQREVRFTTLGHTDLTLGPSLQIPARVLMIEGGVGGGLAVSVFRWAPTLDRTQDLELVGYEPMIRGELGLGIPLRGDHGLRVGAEVIKIWSPQKNWVISDFPNAPIDSQPDTAVFDLYLNLILAYQAWF